ncbi:hypothetical protein J9303_12190 [Bacillaceae bacterium Marseille-Q3522]|nr:hypothetical protein [Bacillaceae bacterium Marseille-Q3522]
MIRESNKTERLFFLYDKLMLGETVNKKEEAARFNVHERSIRRDIDDIKYYLARFYEKQDIQYSPPDNGYILAEDNRIRLQLGEIFILLKVIGDSGILAREEMKLLFHKLTVHFHDVHLVKKLLQEELAKYKPVKISYSLLSLVESAIRAIDQKKIVYFYNERKEEAGMIFPVGLAYKERHFFLAGYEKEEHIKAHKFPNAYLLDDNVQIKTGKKGFQLPLSYGFDEEAFRKTCIPETINE